MKILHELVIEKLSVKRNELKKRQEQFEIMFHNEKDSSCFERNAINNLIIMQQLKSEISELEYLEMLIMTQLNKN